MDEVISACTRLVADFAYYVDRRESDRVAALFTPDGIFDRRGQALRGREAILAAQRARPAEFTTRHACTNIRIDPIDASRARGSCMFVLYRMPASSTGQEATTGELPFTIGDYDDEFEVSDGVWRFSRRIARIVYQRPA